MTFSPYEPCYSCVGGARPGTINLMRALQEKYPYVLNYGIYNCRTWEVGASLSIHACGRAGDAGIPTLPDGRANITLGNPVARDLIAASTALGIHGIIWNRVRYDLNSPTGRYYTGPNPHRDHIHWEQTRHAATYLTLDQARKAIGEEDDQMTKTEILETLGITEHQLDTLRRTNQGYTEARIARSNIPTVVAYTVKLWRNRKKIDRLIG